MNRIMLSLLVAAVAVIVALSLPGVANARVQPNTTFACSVLDFSGQAPIIVDDPSGGTVRVPAWEATCNMKYYTSFHLQYESGGTWHDSLSGPPCQDTVGNKNANCISANEFAAGSHHSLNITFTSINDLSYPGVKACLLRWRATSGFGFHIISAGSTSSDGPSGTSPIAAISC